MHLTPEQIAELFQDACPECGFFTVGPVSTPDGPILAVRCPRNTCASSILPTRALLIDSRCPADIACLHPAPQVSICRCVVRALGTAIPRGVCARRLPSSGGPAAGPLYYRFYAYSDQEFSEVVKHSLVEAVRMSEVDALEIERELNRTFRRYLFSANGIAESEPELREAFWNALGRQDLFARQPLLSAMPAYKR